MGFGKGGVNKPKRASRPSIGETLLCAAAVLNAHEHATPRQAAQCSLPGQQLRPPSRTLVGSSRKRGRTLDEGEKMEIFVQWSLLPTDANGRKHGVEALCERLSIEYGQTISKSYLNRDIVAKAKACKAGDKPFARKERSDKGIPYKYDELVMDWIKWKAEQYEWDFTFQEMAEWLVEAGVVDSASDHGVADAMKLAEWNTHVASRLKPTLTQTHRDNRLKFCQDYLNQSWVEWVDIDEKWFYVKKAYSKRKCPKGVKPGLDTVQHRIDGARSLLGIESEKRSAAHGNLE